MDDKGFSGSVEFLRPRPAKNVNPGSKIFFEGAYSQHVRLEGFLQIYADKWGQGHTCHFGEWRMGGYNVPIFIELIMEWNGL